MPVHRKTNPDRIICNSYFQLRQNYTTGKKYRLLAFFYITKIVTLKSLFVKMVWCHFDSVAGQHGHKSLMQDLTWLTYQSTHHSLTSEATLFHQFPAKERRSFNPLTSSEWWASNFPKEFHHQISTIHTIQPNSCKSR